MLKAARGRGPLATLGVYCRLSGPGFLQSALTLGGGSLASSLFLGVIGGCTMLWVQFLAIVLGAIMLAAISYVTLSLERSPFDGMRREVNPALAWGWLLGTLFANMIWSLPQYALSYAAITENLFPNLVANPDGLGPKLVVTLLLCAFVTGATLLYGSGRGVRIYEAILKLLVAVIIVSFFGVVVRLAMSGTISCGQIIRGLIPDPSHLYTPAGGFPAVLAAIDNETARAWWSDMIVETQRARMIAAASAAIGINMTFLMPFSLLARGWNRSFRGLANFDLGTGMVATFVIATGCVVLAAASQFHARQWEGVVIEADGSYAMQTDAKPATYQALQKSLALRQSELPEVTISAQEVRVASMLLPRTNKELARSLEGLFGNSFMAQKVFGIGVIAMGISTLSLLMLVSGFALCEATGRPHGGKTQKLGTLFAAFGVLWPFLWTGSSRAYLAITIGAIGYTLLPMALVLFIFMLNSKRLLGDDIPRGWSRVTWNTLLGIALLVIGSSSLWTAWTTDLKGFPFGKAVVGLISIAAVGGYVVARRRRAVQTEHQPN